jgi:hypothetical protein
MGQCAIRSSGEALLGGGRAKGEGEPYFNCIVAVGVRAGVLPSELLRLLCFCVFSRLARSDVAAFGKWGQSLSLKWEGSRFPGRASQSKFPDLSGQIPEITKVRRPEWVLALLITGVAVWFHLGFPGRAGALWRDEVNTLNIAGRHSLRDMSYDSFPILMPLIVRGWQALELGGTDTGLRALGTIIGLGLLAVLWLAAWTGNRSPPTLGLALFALNTTVIIYGDSLRAFGVGSLLVVLLFAAMLAFLEKSSWTRTGLLAATAILSVQALFPNAIFVASVCIGGWVVCWRRRLLPSAAKILLVALLTGASLLPYWSRIVPLAESSPTSGISTLRTQFRPAFAFKSLAVALGFPLAQYVWVWAFLALALLVVAALAWRSGSSASNDPGDAETTEVRLLAAATLLCGLGGFALFLWWAALQTQPWYFLAPIALAAACLEVGTPLLRSHLHTAFLAFVTLTALLAVPCTWRGVHWRFTNVDAVTRRLEAQAATEDFILVTPWNRAISFARYFHAKTPWETVPPLEDHSTHRYDLLQRQTQTSQVMRPVLDRISATLQAGHRVWVIGTIDIPARRAPIPADLGPPPREDTGWSAGPYVRKWTSQAAQFLKNHSIRFVEVPLQDAQIISPNETLGLWVADGWNLVEGR